MKIGTVCGAVWATKKCAELTGIALLRVCTQTESFIAADLVGAGDGDRVIVSLGSGARMQTAAPVDAAIVGILDEVNHVDQ